MCNPKLLLHLLASGIYQYPAFISIRHLLVSGIYQYLAFQLYGIDLNHTLKHSISITSLQCIYHLYRPQREGVLFINTKYYMCNLKLLLHLLASGIYQYPAFISIRHLLASGIYQHLAFISIWHFWFPDLVPGGQSQIYCRPIITGKALFLIW